MHVWEPALKPLNHGAYRKIEIHLIADQKDLTVDINEEVSFEKVAGVYYSNVKYRGIQTREHQRA